MYYGSTVIRATIMQAESRTLWTDSSSSQSQSQPSVHTDLAGGISTLRTDWNLRYTGAIGASFLLLGTTSYPPSRFGTRSIATMDWLPWQRRSLIRPIPPFLILSWSWKRGKVEPSVQLSSWTSLYSVGIFWTLSKAMCQAAEGSGV